MVLRTVLLEFAVSFFTHFRCGCGVVCCAGFKAPNSSIVSWFEMTVSTRQVIFKGLV